MNLIELLSEKLDSKYDFDVDLVKAPYSTALYWVTRNVDDEILKKDALEWLDKNGYNTSDIVNDKPYKFKGIGGPAFLASKGRKLTPETIAWLKNKAQEITKGSNDIPDLGAEVPNDEESELTGRDKTNQKIIDIRSAFDNRRSDGHAPGGYLDYDQILEVLKRVGGSKGIVRTLTKDYEELYKEHEDGDFKDHIADILRALKKMGANVKVQDLERKRTRVAKKVSKAKKGEKLTSKEKKVIAKSKSTIPYKVESEKYGIKSIKPNKIDGAKGLLTFNEKTNALAYYKADEGKTLSIKGPRIIGFGKGSIVKRLKKPEDNLEKVQSGSMQRMDKIMNNNVKSKGYPPRPKLSEDTLILKVYR